MGIGQEIIHNPASDPTMESAMTATLALPAGWLTTALEAASVPCLLTEPATAVSALGLGIEPQATWQRLRDLEQGGVPRIVTSVGDYKIVDVERESDFILYYSRQTRNGEETGHWKIFFQETENDPEVLPLSKRELWDSLLKVYTDTALHIQPDEITYSRPELKSSAIREDGTTVHELRLPNGHLLPVVYGAGFTRPPIEGLMKFLGHVPHAALTQIDEMRMVVDENSRLGNTFREGKRLINVFYPPKSETGLSGEDEKKAALFNFLYAMLHETFGHGLMYRNRFLRREMIKIVASGESPPTDYAQTSIEEWFPEGIAERGILTFLNDDRGLDDWDGRFPYLSGLIRHALAVMEEVAEPANENVSLWQKSLRPLGLTG